MEREAGISRLKLVIILFCITLLAIGIGVKSYIEIGIKRQQRNAEEAKKIAEKGMVIALDKINQNANWDGSVPTNEYNKGIFEIRITRKTDLEIENAQIVRIVASGKNYFYCAAF